MSCKVYSIESPTVGQNKAKHGINWWKTMELRGRPHRKLNSQMWQTPWKTRGWTSQMRHKNCKKWHVGSSQNIPNFEAFRTTPNIGRSFRCFLVNSWAFFRFECQVNLMSSDPPAVVFEHCVTGQRLGPKERSSLGPTIWDVDITKFLLKKSSSTVFFQVCLTGFLPSSPDWSSCLGVRVPQKYFGCIWMSKRPNSLDYHLVYFCQLGWLFGSGGFSGRTTWCWPT